MVYICKGNPVTAPGGPIGWVEVQLNSFLTLAIEGVVWSASRPGRLYPRERPGTHCTGGWVGRGAGLNRCGKSRPTGIRSPVPPAHSESQYQLRYPSSRFMYVCVYIHTHTHTHTHTPSWLQEMGYVCCLFVFLKQYTGLIHDIRCNGNTGNEVMYWCCRFDLLVSNKGCGQGLAFTKTPFKWWTNFLSTCDVSQHRALSCRSGSPDLFQVSYELWVLQIWCWGR